MDSTVTVSFMSRERQPRQEGWLVSCEPDNPVQPGKSGSQPHSAPNSQETPIDGSATVVSSQPRKLATETWTHDIQGLRLGHYIIEKPLGVGGMAAVLLAIDTHLDRPAALKILPPAVSGDKETLERFHKEAKSAAKLDHENIARIFASGEDQGLHFIAFEFVEGVDLKSLLQSRGRLPTHEAVQLAYQACLGLEHAAMKGMVHRDIKPSNLVLTPTGRLKIIDMGLARNLDQTGEEALTRSGVTLGTFDYLAPEQAIDPRLADARSDIYSLGCTLYHLLTGKPPVPEGSAALKLTHHQTIKPTDPRNFVPSLSAGLVRLVEKMLAKKPVDRYQDFAQLKDAFEKLASAEGFELVSGTVAKRQSRKSIIPQIAAAAAGIGILGCGLWFFSPEQKPYLPAQKTDFLPTDFSASRQTSDSVSQSTTKVSDSTARYEEENPTASSLESWLRDHANASKVEIVLHGDLDLTTIDGGSDALLITRAKEIVIRSAHPGNKATLRYHHDGRIVSGSLSLLHAEAEILKLESLRFVLDCRESPVAIKGLSLSPMDSSKGLKADLEKCEWIQAGNTFDQRNRVSSVEIHGGMGNTINTRISDCVFLGFREAIPDSVDQPATLSLIDALTGGQDAVTRKGFVSELRIEQSLFGPHATVLRCVAGSPVKPSAIDSESSTPGMPVMPDAPRADGNMSMESLPLSTPGARQDGNGRVWIQNSSIMTGSDGRAIAVQDHVGGVFTMRRTIMAGSTPTAKSTLLYCNGQESSVRFLGRGNRYFRVSTFFKSPTLTREDEKLADFQKHLARERLGEDKSLDLQSTPWKSENPLNEFAEAEIALGPESESAANLGPKIMAAFSPSERKDFQLRWLESGIEKFAGAERFAGLSFYRSTEKRPPAPIKRVVVSGQQDESQGIHPSIDHALSRARSGDVILLRHDGPIEMNPVQVSRPGFVATIRPEPGSCPHLHWKSRKEETACFQIDGAIVRIEEMPITITCPDGVRQAAMAMMSRQGQLILNDCLVTMAGGSGHAFLGGMRDPETMARAEDSFRAAQPSRLVLEGCFVRGDGLVAKLALPRTLEVEVRQTALALSAGLAALEIPDAEPGSINLPVRIHQCLVVAAGIPLTEQQHQGLAIRSTESSWFNLGPPETTLVQVLGTPLRSKDRMREILDTSKSVYWGFSAPFGAREPLSGKVEDSGPLAFMLECLEIPVEDWHESLPEDTISKPETWQEFKLDQLEQAWKKMPGLPALPVKAASLGKAR